MNGLWELILEPNPYSGSETLHFGTGFPPFRLSRVLIDFSVTNSDRVLVQLTGLDLVRKQDPAFVARIRTGGGRNSVYEATSPQSTLEFEVMLPAGSYSLEVDAVDAARALLLGSIHSQAISSVFRVSGWIEHGLVGFAAFYSPGPFTVRVKTRSRSLGTFGADCLLLDVKDSRKVSVCVPHVA